MGGVFRSGPKFLAVFTYSNARRYAVRTKTFGDIAQFTCEVFVGRNQNSSQFTSLTARSYSFRTRIPGDISQFPCGAFFGRGRNPWQFCPMGMRGVIQAEPKFLAIVTRSNASRFSGRTKIPGDIYQSECGVIVCQNQNSHQFFPV